MNILTAAASTLGFAAVALGAFGAHALRERLTLEAISWWETATLYALVHAVAALAVGLSGRGGWSAAGGWAFVAGALIFAGTLYAMALGAPRWLGAATPIGGIALLAGWGLLAADAFNDA